MNIKSLKEFKSEGGYRKQLKTLKLMLASMYKNSETYIFIFVVPVVISAFIYFFNSNMFRTDIRYPIVASIILSVGLGMMFLSCSVLNDWKDSIFIKRIRISGIGKNTMLTMFIISAITLAVPGLFFNVGILMILDLFNTQSSTLNWLKFTWNTGGAGAIFGILFGYFSFCIISLLISVILTGWIKKRLYSELVITLFILIIIFGSDMFFDPNTVRNNLFYTIVGYLVPQKYAVWTIFMFAAGVHVDNNNIEIVTSTDGFVFMTYLWQPIVFSITILISFFGITYTTFSISRK